VSAFLSGEPSVRLVSAFDRPLEGAMAAARTCYSSKGVVLPAAPSAKDLPLAADIFRAGHHTVFQHAHFQFAISNISRLFVWSFLHSHPFYNSEQVSQRYVPVAEEGHVVPALAGAALDAYRDCVAAQHGAYRRLVEVLAPAAAKEYFDRFPSRAKSGERWKLEIKRKAQEAARYVLPLATVTYLHHTVSALTLFRYHRLCRQWDAPEEQRLVVERMVDLAIDHDAGLRSLLEEPVVLEETPEYSAFSSLAGREAAGDFARRFDESLEGRTSKLVDYKIRNEETVADAVRQVLGRGEADLPDAEAIAIAADPSRNKLLGDTLNLTTVSKLTRALGHAAYTFRKKLSHAADSQNQRHRMTPASRPCIPAVFPLEPDYVTPCLIAADDVARRIYDEAMSATWSQVNRMLESRVPKETAQYLLPNGLSVRLTESADLLALRHKMAMRLCYNSQEEIWRASIDEAVQIAGVNPRLGRYLLPPCGLRARAGAKPVCPEGSRYCGIKVWRLGLDEYHRVI